MVERRACHWGAFELDVEEIIGRIARSNKKSRRYFNTRRLEVEVWIGELSKNEINNQPRRLVLIQLPRRNF